MTREQLPDGSPFPHWEDETDYERTYHVDGSHPAADDANPGTPEEPFATISQAAAILEPGEKVIVHEGVYRERVDPARGGTGPDAMIGYEAVPDAEVVVKGSQVWSPDAEPSREWNVGGAGDVWTGTLPRDWFVGYQPFQARNLPSADRYYLEPAAAGRLTEAEHKRLLGRRGAVFVDGEPLTQVFYPHELGEQRGTFWVQEPGRQLHFRLPEGYDEPKEATIEVTTQEQVFAPSTAGLGHVRVTGFTFEHAADGVPIPQRAMVSANRGHHWRIENNAIRWANATGIDVGDETWHRRERDVVRDESGHHVIRGNHIARCGACGIAAMFNNQYTLVEDNVIEHVGDRNVERIWETAGLKFHTAEGALIRNNVFRHIRHASGLWLDYRNGNTRVTGNVIADVTSLKGGIYSEVNHDPILIDNNVVWNVRGDDPDGAEDMTGRGHGINVDTGEGCTVAHNLIGAIGHGAGVSANLDQSGRIVDGRVGLCRDHAILNNVIVGCSPRIEFGHVADNQADGNAYDEADDDSSFRIIHPEPETLHSLASWQDVQGFDEHGSQREVAVSFDADTDTLSVEYDGEPPEAVATPAVEDQPIQAGPDRIGSESTH